MSECKDFSFRSSTTKNRKVSAARAFQLVELLPIIGLGSKEHPVPRQMKKAELYMSPLFHSIWYDVFRPKSVLKGVFSSDVSDGSKRHRMGEMAVLWPEES